MTYNIMLNSSLKWISLTLVLSKGVVHFDQVPKLFLVLFIPIKRYGHYIQGLIQGPIQLDFSVMLDYQDVGQDYLTRRKPCVQKLGS